MCKMMIRFSGVLVLAGAATVAGCGGGGSGPSGKEATIDMTSVGTAINQVSTVIPICQVGAGGAAPGVSANVADPTPWLQRLMALRRHQATLGVFAVQALGPTRPADEFGECGGRMTYPDYSHASGVTTGTLAFESYCTLNENTGERNILTGRISFVNTGTPSASGPITSRIDASSPNGITVVTQTATGGQLSTQNFRFTDYVYRPGVPGGSPTASSPDRLTLAEGSVTDVTGGKSYRQTGYALTMFGTPGGGEQVTVTGRGYRSDGSYFQVATGSPLTSDANGNILGGALTFTGAGNSTATVTLVPGNTFQATMRVNGVPVTNVPACK